MSTFSQQTLWTDIYSKYVDNLRVCSQHFEVSQIREIRRPPSNVLPIPCKPNMSKEEEKLKVC